MNIAFQHPPEEGFSQEAQILEYIEQFAQLFQQMLQESLSKHEGAEDANMFNPQAMVEMLAKGVHVDTAKLFSNQMAFMEQQISLWQHATKAMMGESVDAVVSPERSDTRFKDGDWTANPVYNYLKQAYLLNSKMLEGVVDSLQFDDEKLAGQVKFYTRQFISSVSPSNYIMTNPEVCRDILATKGKNLIKGMENFLADLEQSPADAFKISQTDAKAFELGKNLAASPGKVVFKNKLMQLIQYSPTTDTVFERPLLIMPPFINKYYILDMDRKKSMVRWLVDQGYTVFMISWVNPDSSFAETSFEDYMHLGPLAAVDAVASITGSERINVVGYCIGGTLLAATQAYLKAQKDKRINSLTFFTALLDFSEPGELGNYISESMMPLLEQSARSKGVFDGRVLGMSFSLLRENSLFWSYFINNYLKGQDPAAFDILYWNSDSTNLPAETFLYYIRNTYLDNKLIEPGGMELSGVPIDISTVDVPSYFVATANDHIVLWQASYKSAQALGGDTRFILAGSGHLAGVINPPEGGKYPHWTNDAVSGALSESPEQWMEGATQVEGSWWPDWHKWLSVKSGEQVPARKPGSKKAFPALEDAPGSYVKVRI
ncbi:class I poly(R)-hydroxyalkanoic acid synthase [Maricurvus nonylphenolicus]|uniref:PHA/PHB synthase family protein n=1 Tax=Maricurvus nonylphenolicus TaxID=1008307 RepID=UPI0036F1C672